MMRSANPLMSVPSRVRLTDVIMSRLDPEVIDLSKAAFEKATAVSVSLDLCMSSGAQDIFSVLVYKFEA